MNDWEEFLIQLVQPPSLPGARCRGRTELFDATIHGVRGAPPDDVAYARRAATRLCESCPALADCRTWLETLPRSQWPLGVVAGQLNTSPKETA